MTYQIVILSACPDT